MNKVRVSGTDQSKFSSQLEGLLQEARPRALGAATAFLSVSGADTMIYLTKKFKIKTVKFIAGLSGGVSHPDAIRKLHTHGYDVRLGIQRAGIFHPKLLVGGNMFKSTGEMPDCSCGYIGSSNLTKGGFQTNLEVGLGTKDPNISKQLGDAFLEIWSGGKLYSERNIEQYAEFFARRQKKRSIDDLGFLEIDEATSSTKSKKPSVDVTYATEVWTGLQSFTGEHAFQVEFPKSAGIALRRVFGTTDGRVNIECSDGITRDMIFRYYTNNGMYRLNVPNDMPGVKWARSAHDGILVIRREGDRGHQIFSAEISRGKQRDEIVARSKALRTNGKTNTREYGWS